MNNSNDITIYKSSDGQISFNVNVFNDTVWITQKQMAELFDKERSVITKHIKNVFYEEELDKKSNVHFLHIPYSDKPVEHYSLDVIISVGYRVKSKRGTQFRKWANSILKQYLLGGYAINESRIRTLEKKIDSLPSKIKEEILSEIEKKFDIKLKEFNKTILKIANRPITINNQISVISHKLENKAVELLDQIIKQTKNDNKLKTQLEITKEDIMASPKNEKIKLKIVKFFNTLGDHNSDLHKTIEGVGISKKMIVELVKLGEKIRNLLF